MTTDEILKRHGIIKYNGRLIFPDKNRVHFWTMGKKYDSFKDVKKAIDEYKKHGKKIIHETDLR